MGPQWKWDYFACPDVWEELITLLALCLGETGIEIRLGVRAGVLSASEQRYLSLSLGHCWGCMARSTTRVPQTQRFCQVSPVFPAALPEFLPSLLPGHTANSKFFLQSVPKYAAQE